MSKNKKTPEALKMLYKFMDMENIAKDLEDDILNTLGNECVKHYEIDLASRSTWETQTENAMKLAKQIREDKSKPWDGASNVKYPLLTEAAIQFASRALPELIKGSDIVKVEVTGDDPDGSKDARAKNISCYSDDTEALTIDGWKLIKDIEIGDSVYSRDKQGHASYYPVNKIISRHSDNIVHIKGNSIDLMVTEDHNMVIDIAYKNEDSFFIKAGYFLDSKGMQKWRIPLTSKREISSNAVNGVYGLSNIAYLRFLGWYLSKGSACYSKAGSGTRQINPSTGGFVIAQSKEKNPEKYAILIDDINSCGFTYSEDKIGVNVHAKSMPEGLKKELRSLGKCDEKYVPRMVMSCSNDEIKQLLETLYMGDGHITPRGYQYYTSTSIKLASDVQELCQLIGLRADIGNYKHRVGDIINGKVVKSRKPCYLIAVRVRNNAMVSRLKWSKVAYNKLVYCLEINPHHTLYVRRNGKAAWCGNCHMSWQLDKQMSEWIPDTDRALHIHPIMGGFCRKSWFNKALGRNVSELILLQDYVVNNKANKNRLRRESHRQWYYANDILELIRSGIWLECELGQGTNPDDQEEDDVGHEIIEQHCFKDLDNDGYKEPYIVTVHKQSGKVLRIVARFDKNGIRINDKGEIVKIIPITYFTMYEFIPDPGGEFYPLGFGQLAEPLNESVNSLINQLIDSGTISNRAGGFIARGVRFKGSKLDFSPFEWKPIDVSADDLRKSIFPLPVREPSPVLFQLLGMLVASAKDTLNIKAVLTGEMKGIGANASPNTVMALIEQGMKVFSGIYKRFYRSLTEELRKLYRLNSIYLNAEESFRVAGKPFVIGQADYQADDLEVLPVADPNMASDMQRRLQAEAVLKVSGRPGINEVEITRRYIKALHLPEEDKLLLTDEQVQGKEPPPYPPKPDPRMVIAQAKAQDFQARVAEAGARFKLDIDKHQFELQELQAKIENLKANTLRTLADASDIANADAMERYKAEMDRLGAEVAMKVKVAMEMTGRGGPGAEPPGGSPKPGPGPQPQPGQPTPGGGPAATANPNMAAIPGRQEGGPVTAGQPYVVGEAGPEVIVPEKPGTVIPVQETYIDKVNKALSNAYVEGLHGWLSGAGAPGKVFGPFAGFGGPGQSFSSENYKGIDSMGKRLAMYDDPNSLGNQILKATASNPFLQGSQVTANKDPNSLGEIKWRPEGPSINIKPELSKTADPLSIILHELAGHGSLGPIGGTSKESDKYVSAPREEGFAIGVERGIYGPHALFTEYDKEYINQPNYKRGIELGKTMADYYKKNGKLPTQQELFEMLFKDVKGDVRVKKPEEMGGEENYDGRQRQ